MVVSKAYKPQNFESHKSIKLSFTDIWGLCSKISLDVDFPWIKLSWHSCSMWDTLGWLNWFWQFFCEGLSSFNPNGFCNSYACPSSLCKERTSFCTGLISRKLPGIFYVFDWLYSTQSLTSFSYLDHLLHLFTWFFILIHNKDEVLSITHILMYLQYASNPCTMVLEAVKLLYVSKQKKLSLSQKLGSCDFCWIANSNFNIGKPAIPPLFNDLRCCLW